VRTPSLACAALLLAAPALSAALDAPVAPAGSPAAALAPEESAFPWRLALATGVAARLGGMRLDPPRDNPVVLLTLAGEADGAWSRRFGQAARVRFRLFTGGEHEIYVPSDGEVEAAYTLGRREFRFVVARLEAARHPAVGLDAFVQAATLPSFEGSLPLDGEGLRLDYHVAPVEAAWVRYHGAWHVSGAPGWPGESDRVVAATAARVRATLLLAPAMPLSAEAEVAKLWRRADLLVGAEGSFGYQALDRTALFSLSVRWNRYTRRGPVPDTSEASSEVLIVLGATLAW
jgi:hypothetical protein